MDNFAGYLFLKNMLNLPGTWNTPPVSVKAQRSQLKNSDYSNLLHVFLWEEEEGQGSFLNLITSTKCR